MNRESRELSVLYGHHSGSGARGADAVADGVEAWNAGHEGGVHCDETLLCIKAQQGRE